MNNILVIGACGQIGVDLTQELRKRHGEQTVIAADIREPKDELKLSGPFESLDILDRAQLDDILARHEIKQVYHLAAMLSASAEKEPLFAWKLNMDGLLNVLEAAVQTPLNKIFWPSSIAVFGPTTPRDNAPQDTIMDPSTVYGISKVAGERWVEYYHRNKQVDIRSLRYPGLVSYKGAPGGGTTDYAVEIFHQAKKSAHYTCYLKEDTRLPMMYMPDAIRASVELMNAPSNSLSIRSSYNVSAFSFSPGELAKQIQKLIPEFHIDYEPDFRQQISEGWPASVNDDVARKDWGWENIYDLPAMCKDMLENISSDILEETR